MEIKKQETKLDIMNSYSLPECIKKFNNVTTAIAAFKTESHSLANLRKSHGIEFSVSLIKIWIISLNDFLNVSRKMTPAQIDEVSLYIYQDYYYFNIADLYLITSRIKKGHYGNLFESIDGLKILSFFAQYANERLNSCEQEGIIEHDRLKYKEEKSRK